MTIRVGYGYDVHRLAENRDFWMGGVKIDHHVGLLGHSDADVLIHAISPTLIPNIKEQIVRCYYNGPSNLSLQKGIVWEMLTARFVRNVQSSIHM